MRKLYIPRHLEEIPLISTLARMAREFRKSYSTSVWPDPFEKYRESLRSDPVRKLVDSFMTGSGIDEKIEKVKYLTHLLYSNKGTGNVLRLIEGHLIPGLKFKVTGTGSIRVDLPESVSTKDYDTTGMLRDALECLMYFKELVIYSETRVIYIQENTKYFPNASGLYWNEDKIPGKLKNELYTL